MAMPTRPSSARQRGHSAARKLRGNGVAEEVDMDQYNLLSREDLLSSIIQLKKQNSVLENERSLLKAENRRWEMEYLKQQQRFEKILDPKFSKNSQAVVELRKEVEKAGLVRQLKQQINSLRHDLMEKEAEADELHSCIKAGYLAELQAEKEEYYAEVQRLRQLLKEKFAALTVAAKGGTAPDTGSGHGHSHGRSRRQGHKSVEHLRKSTSPYVSHHLHGPAPEEDEGAPDTPGPFRRSRPSSAGGSSAGAHSAPRSQTGTYSRPINKLRPQSAGSTASRQPRHTSDVIADITNTPFDREYHAPQQRSGGTGSGAGSGSSGAMNLRTQHHQERQEEEDRMEVFDRPDEQGQISARGMPEVSPLPVPGGLEEDDGDDADDFIGGLESGKQVFVPPMSVGAIVAGTGNGLHTDASAQSGQQGFGLDAEPPLFTEMPAPKPAAVAAFKVGDKVEGQFSGGTKWYKGRVYRLIAPSASSSPRTAPGGDDVNEPPEYLYHIRYDDGDEEQKVPAERIRLLAGSQPSSPKPKTAPSQTEQPAPTLAPVAAPATSQVPPQGQGGFLSGSLHVSGLRACITKHSAGDIPDVYLRVQLGRWKADTGIIKDVNQFCTACYDNLDFVTDVTAPELQFEPLVVQVWDKNIMTQDLLIGEASVPLLMAYISAGSGAHVDISAELLDRRGKVTGTVVVTAAALTGRPPAPAGPPRLSQISSDATPGSTSNTGSSSAPVVSSSAPTPKKQENSSSSSDTKPTPAAVTSDVDEAALESKKKKDDIDFMNYLADLSETDFSETEAGAAGRGARLQEKALAHIASPKAQPVTAAVSPKKLGSDDLADYDEDDFDA